MANIADILQVITGGIGGGAQGYYRHKTAQQERQDELDRFMQTMGLQRDIQGEAARHNVATEGIATRGQDIDVSQFDTRLQHDTAEANRQRQFMQGQSEFEWNNRMQQEEMGNRTALGVAGTHAGATRYAAELAAGSREAVAGINAGGKMDVDPRVAAITNAGNQAKRTFMANPTLRWAGDNPEEAAEAQRVEVENQMAMMYGGSRDPITGIIKLPPRRTGSQAGSFRRDRIGALAPGPIEGTSAPAEPVPAGPPARRGFRPIP